MKFKLFLIPVLILILLPIMLSLPDDEINALHGSALMLVYDNVSVDNSSVANEATPFGTPSLLPSGDCTVDECSRLGDNSYVVFPNVDQYEAVHNFTICMGVLVTCSAGNLRSMGRIDAEANGRWVVGAGALSTNDFYWGIYDGASRVTQNNNNQVICGAMTHVCLVANGTGGSMQMYYNGSFRISGSLPVDLLSGRTEDIWIGASELGGTTNDAALDIDEFYWFNKSLSPEEIIYLNATFWAGNHLLPIVSIDYTPVNITLINLTSEGGLGLIIFNGSSEELGKDSGDAKTNSTTPSFGIVTNASATCALLDLGITKNYTDSIAYNANSECSTTGGTFHFCTLTTDNATARTGLHNFSVSCKNADGVGETLTSGNFTVNITDPIPPNITLYTPENNAFFILGDNNTNIDFNFSATDNVDENFSFKLYIDDVLKITNTTYLNGTNVTYRFDVTTIGIHTWYLNTTDSYNNKNQSFTNTFIVAKTANITILLDGDDGTGKYEYPKRRSNKNGSVSVTKRIVNITTLSDEETTICISIDDYINLSCNAGGWSYYYNVTELRQDRVLNGSTIVNMSEGTNYVAMRSDNTSDILYLTINLTGYRVSGKYPEGVEIDIDKDNKSELKLPGKLRDNVIETFTFIANGKNRSAYNTTFQAGGSVTITINVSSVANLQNFSVEVLGSDLDAENEFKHIEHFNGTIESKGINDSLSYKVDAPLGYFDDFKTNTSRWSLSGGSGGCTLDYEITGDENLESSCFGNEDEYLNYDDKAGDLRNSSKAEILFTWYNAGSGGDDVGSASLIIYATDGTNRVALKSYENDWGSGAGSQTFHYNITPVKMSEDYKNWQVLQNGSFQSNIDISPLDFDKQIKLEFYMAGGNKVASTISLYHIKWSGAWLNRSTNNGTYQHSGNYTSVVLNKTETNISRAILTASVYEPEDTKINFYLSNTCNYTDPIFESATSGVQHTFNTIGNEICYRAELNSSINITSPIVRKVTVEIVKSSLENISADFGSNGVINWRFDGTLNSTSSPKVVNGSLIDFETYREDNCVDDLVCSYPVTFSVLIGSVLEIRDVNTTINLENIELNKSKVVNKSIVNMTISFIGGLLKLSGIDLNFMGNKNFTINATHNVNSTYLQGKASQIAWFVHSRFNWSLPYTFTSAIVPYGIRTVNSTNVTPFGQTLTIPIINITNYAPHAIDIGLKINRTFDCLEVRALNSSNTSLIGTYGINLTNSTHTFKTNISKGSHQGIWLFYDLYNCDPSVARSLRLNIEEESCCLGCKRCWNITT